MVAARAYATATAASSAGKPITCLAAVAHGPKRPLVVEQIAVAPPKKGEVRVKLLVSGVCHTDAFSLSGEDPEYTGGAVIFGHEGFGVVESVGDSVQHVRPGDHVIPLYIPECGKCSYCTHHKGTNLCQAIRATQGRGLMPDSTTRFSSLSGESIMHYMGTSTFSQYTVLPEISVAKVSPRANQSFRTRAAAALLGCGITTGVGAVRHTAKVEAGATVAVFGLGAVGLSVVQGAKKAKAQRILAIDINPAKFDMARKLGATDCVNPQEHTKSIQEVIVDMTGGVDYSFECVGNVKLMRAALECAHKGWGVSTIIGVAGAEEISTRPFQLVTGRRWQGSAFGGVKGRSQLPSMVDEYLHGQLNVDDFVTHTLPLARINEAFTLMKAGQSIRTVIDLWA